MPEKTPFKALATFSVSLHTAKEAEAIADGLRPEVFQPLPMKVGARITVSGRKLNLQFQARDTTSLRAIVSSHMRMLAAAINVSNSLLRLEQPSSRSEIEN